MYKVISEELKNAGCVYSKIDKTYYFNSNNGTAWDIVNKYNLTVQYNDIVGMYWLLDILE